MKLISTKAVAWLAATIMIASAAFAFGQDPAPLPDGDGKKIVETKCTVCHDTSMITSEHLDRAGWEDMVKVMIASGAEVTDQEMPVLLDYLVKNWGPEASK